MKSRQLRGVSFTGRLLSLLGSRSKSPSVNRKLRRSRLELLETRKLLAAAIFESYQRAEGEGNAGPAVSSVLYYSPSVSGFVVNSNRSKLFVDDADIVKLTLFANHHWRHEIYFDGSDVGLNTSSENIDAFSLRADGSLLVSTLGSVQVPGVSAGSNDVLLFQPTRLGSTTQGSWQIYIDGDDIGLNSWEGIDGLSELLDGSLVISTHRTAQVPGISGNVSPEDLIVLTPTSTGSLTAGTWSRYFDGSDVQLSTTSENIDGVSIDSNGSTIHISTKGYFSVPGLLGFGRDILTFEAEQLGSTTQGEYLNPLRLDGSHRGLLFNSIDAIHLPSAVAPEIAPIDPLTLAELATFQLPLVASDPDTPASQLRWSMLSGPEGAHLDPDTGLFIWTPSEQQGPGDFDVTVVVTDGELTDQSTFSIAVTEVNQSPVITTIADQTIDGGTIFEYQVLASDLDSPTNNLTFSLDASPSGATINPLTGAISWMPSEAGNAIFIVKVTDDGSPSLSATEEFTITVLADPDGSIVVTEGTFVRQKSFSIELGQTEGTRTLSFSLDAAFDRSDTATSIGDVFSVYIVDPNNPSQTLLDRGESGTAIFSLSEDGVSELATGIVQFNGHLVTVDLSKLGELSNANVLLQLLSHDADSTSRITISEIMNTLIVDGIPAEAVLDTVLFSPIGGPLDYEALTASTHVSAELANIRFDVVSGLYTAELRLTATSNVGSTTAISFPGLSPEISLLNPSGINASGTPYLNLSPTTPSGGLRANSPTQKVLLRFAVPANTPFVLTPEIVVGLPNRAPMIEQVDPVTVKPGDARVIPIDVTDLDGDRVTVSIRALNGMPTSTLRADNTLLITPRSNDLGVYQVTVIASDGALQSTQDVVITVVEDLVQTTRISGIVRNTNDEPLAGVPVQLGRHQSETAADGSFTIELPSFETPTEVFDIVVPIGDPQFDPFSTGDRTITLFRSGFDVTTGTSISNPRRHTNLVSSFIDASVVYGSDEVRAAALRVLDGSGKLKTSAGDLLPVNNSATFPAGTLENVNSSQRDPNSLFAAGDVRTNENVGLISLHTLLVREHNRKATEIAAADPTLTDEVIYQESRRWVTAIIQQITYNEFLPLLIGSTALPAYGGYSASADPSVSGLFSAAAFRFGHSVSVSAFNRLDSANQSLAGGPLSIREGFFNANVVKQDGIEPYLRGMASQLSEELDTTVISELRNFLFGPPGAGGMDLVALNIQRGRDLGLPSYNRARQDMGLTPVTTFAQISSNVAVQNALASVYPTVNDIDVWVGGLAEDHVAGAMVGELFQSVIKDQFIRLRDADRFWFENSQFTATELASLRSLTMSDLIVRNTSISSLPANVFTTATSPGGFGAGGSAATIPPNEYRSLDGSGNNVADPSLGQTGTNLLTNYTLDYGDGISTPAGADRVSTRQISNSVFAGPSGQVNSLSATNLFTIWGQLLTHDTNLSPGGTDNTLKIFGNLAPAGSESYPFVAEKLPLMFEEPVTIGANNTIARPIYLPALNTADAVTINPNVDTTVTVPISAGDAPATVFVRAGTLETRQGNLFTGQLSITEVPASLTPISLPAGLVPDTVVTIQPGEMIFTEPAPLTLPNRANLPAGTELDLWSIDPITGAFEIVGKGRVSTDRSVIETVEGGIRNSSWHMFVFDLLIINFTEDDLNLDDECEPCTVVFPANSVVEAHSGAVVESHDLVTYISLGETRGVQLVYNSLRADPRPIVHNSLSIDFEGTPLSGSLADIRLVSSLTVRGNGLSLEVPGAPEEGALGTGTHFWRLGGGGNIALQADLRSQPTGLYDYTMNSGFVLSDGVNVGRISGARAAKTGQFLHVNSIASPFGSGWELAGLKYLVESSEGHMLMVDGGGAELLFRLAANGQSYVSPPGEFSTLEKLPNGTFQYTTTERTVSTFDASNRLISVVDRNGNQTSYAYSDGLLTSITDPVGLVTTFNYAAGKISSIVDPANRTTQFDFDAQGNLIRVTDPDGTFRTWGYDDNHHIVSEVDQRGFREEMQYDFAGRAKQATRKDGSVLRYNPVQTQGLFPPSATTSPGSAPNASSRDAAISTFVDGNGVVTQVELNRAGQSTARTDGVGSQGTVVYSDQLLPISMTDARGFTSQYTYDSRGNLTSVVDAISAGGGAGGVSFGSPSLMQESVGQGFHVADLNGDGFPDVINGGQVLINNGAGGFLEPIYLDSILLGGGTKYIEIADMNGDGLLDIVSSSGRESDADGNSYVYTLFIWLANPDGTYASVDAYSTRLFPGEEERVIPQPGLVVADFNNDSHPDVLLTQSVNEFGGDSGTLILYLNNGSGGLQNPVLIYPAFNGGANLPPRLHDVEAADLNGDGNQDLVLSNSREVGTFTGPLANVVTIMLGNGDGTFGPPVNYDLGFDVTDIPFPDMEQAEVELADLNNDGNIDVVVASTNHGFATVLLGNGLGGFGAPNVFATVPADAGFYGELRFTAIEIADLNGDSVLDIALASFDNKQIFVYLGAGDGTFSAGTSYNYDTESRFFFDAPFTKVDGLFAVDFDNDGKVDLLTASPTGNDFAYLRGNGDGTFVSWDEIALLDGDNVAPEQIETLDLDADGIQDIVTRTFRSGAEVRYGLGSGQYSAPVLLDSGITGNSNSSTTRDLEIIDANDDGFKDVVLTFTSDTFVLTHHLFVNNGDRTFAAPATIDFNIASSRFGAGLASGDFNNDGIDDLIAPEIGTLSEGEPRSLKVALGDGNGSFTATTIPLALRPWEIVVADINNDGNQDLMVSLLNVSGGRVFLGDGLGGFTESQNLAIGNATSLRAADLNGDGFVDLAFLSLNNGEQVVDGAYVLNNGTGQFGAVSFIGAAPASRRFVQSDADYLSVGDVNRDGLSDIVVSSRTHYHIATGRSEGGFSFVSTVRGGGFAPSIADMDNDGVADIVGARSGRVLFGSPHNESAITIHHGVQAVQAAPRQFTYESVFNQMTSMIDELGRQTFFEIDPANGNTLSVTQVVGLPDSTSGETDDLVTQFGYTASGQVATITDPLGRLTQFTYDTFGRNTQITLAVGTVDEGSLSFTYDAAGNVLTATDPNLNVSSFTWDALNRRTSFTDAVLASATYVYDARGSLVESTDRASSTVTYQYDALSRIIRATDAQDNVTVIGYDLFGNRTSVIDPLNQQSTYTYDGRNRLRTHTDPDGGVTQFIYDAADNLTRLIDPVGNVTQFVYDARGRQTREVDPLGAVLKYDYDLVDNLVRKTDRNNRVTEFNYDDVDRLTSERWLNANNSVANAVNYSYDKASNLTALADFFSSLSWAYDSRDRVITESNSGTPGAPVVQLAYAYDAASNVLSVNDTINGTAGAATSYLYDALNRMRRISQTDNGGLSVADKRVDIAYNGIGQFTSINRYADLAGSLLVVGTTYQFDSLNRLTRLAHDNSTSTVAFYDYVYDADSRISSVANVDGVTNYTYDDRDQLIGADHADASNPDETYQYDANGNRLQSHLHNGGYVTGAANRLLSDGTFNYQYDAEGNRIRQTNIATGEYREFEYDHRNRLVAVVDFSAAAVEQQRVEFVYDAIGRRISKTVDGVITHFVYDGHGVILDFVDQDGVGGNAPVFSQRYLHGPAIDQVFAQESDVGDVSWLLADHLGTTRDIVDESGQLENHIKYDSFGNVIEQSDASVSTRYLYTGRELDEEIGLMYYRTRFYDAATGRFLSEDTIRFNANDANLYRYVKNGATLFRDPLGENLNDMIDAAKAGFKEAGELIDKIEKEIDKLSGMLDLNSKVNPNEGQEINGEALRQELRSLNDAKETAEKVRKGHLERYNSLLKHWKPCISPRGRSGTSGRGSIGVVITIGTGATAAAAAYYYGASGRESFGAGLVELGMQLRDAAAPSVGDLDIPYVGDAYRNMNGRILNKITGTRSF